MGELARQYDALLADVHAQPIVHNVDSRALEEARDIFFDEVRHVLERRLSALAIYHCIRAERLTSSQGSWDRGDVLDILTIDGVSPMAYMRQATEEEKKVIRFGVIPIDRIGEQVLAAIEEADETFGQALYDS